MKSRVMDSRKEQPSRYKIYVKMMKTVALDVKGNDTVDQIKSKIDAIEGIDKSKQALFFAGNHLENDNRLADYNIMTNSSVDLYVTDGMKISVKIPSVGKIIKLNVNASQSVTDLKEVIEQKGGIPFGEQVLMYAGQQLEDNKLLNQCGLSDGHTLHVLVCPTDKLRISVNVDGERTMNLDVKSWYSIADVKLMIETLVGLPASAQILMRTQSGGVEALEDPETPQNLIQFGHAEALQDSETLQNQHVNNNDVLMLYQNVQFFIKTYEGRTLTMSMRTCDTTDEVMEKIEEKLYIKSGAYYLLYRGRVLCLGDTLQKHKVENNSTIDIRLRNSHVVIQSIKKQ